MTARPAPLWTPRRDARAATRLGRFLDRLESDHGVELLDHEAAWRWSIDHLAEFWRSLSDEFEIAFSAPPAHVLAGGPMPDVTWFPGAELNYAQQVLAAPGVADTAPIVWSLSQSREPVVLTLGDVRREVAACRAGLARLGIGRGDRVAGYVPNIAESFVALLATASLGAVWSSCAPEFGTRSVLDRFAQIEPSVLFVVDGYRYGDKAVDRVEEVAAIRAGLPSVRHTVVLPYLEQDPGRVPGAIGWDVLLGGADEARLEFEQVPFDHPLYVLFSSGTTGLPKAIVHGHGGITLEHAKQLGLYGDLQPGDRFFWFSTTGWMMWNYLASGPMVGASIVSFDGDPGHHGVDGLWRMAADLGVTFFGTSAPFLMACRKAGLRPGKSFDLRALRTIGSTGAPLPPEGFEWVYDAVSADVLLSSVSGGTDVCTAFVGGSPLTPVRAGEISCRYLGCAVAAFDPDGHPVVGEQGELVITEPMPSMPVGFWGDADGSRYRAAYFEDFPGVWRHGDWITIAADGTCVISGRSDSTLNRGGVRLGTSDFYAAVEELPEVADSLVVHLDDAGDGVGELLLFIRLAPEAVLDDDLRARIAAALRTQLSPRHVPDRIEAVPAVPRTLSGKKLEVPVKRILAGMPADQAASRGALVDPGALDVFERLAAERR
ncbi:MAG TPA: acetoacetate--CoA ligase [Acidimicrobiales bacterium]|jgi:acetoacetyl-CoA synthetase|nr:acetoacetate--CoA ligase [Acidimicrobiales bacterium]